MAPPDEKILPSAVLRFPASIAAATVACARASCQVDKGARQITKVPEVRFAREGAKKKKNIDTATRCCGHFCQKNALRMLSADFLPGSATRYSGQQEFCAQKKCTYALPRLLGTLLIDKEPVFSATVRHAKQQ